MICPPQRDLSTGPLSFPRCEHHQVQVGAFFKAGALNTRAEPEAQKFCRAGFEKVAIRATKTQTRHHQVLRVWFFIGAVLKPEAEFDFWPASENLRFARLVAI